MFKKFLLFFKAQWLCNVVTRLVSGLSSVIVVCDYIQEELKGSPVLAKVQVYLIGIRRLADSSLAILSKVADFVCTNGIEDIKVQSVEDALTNLQIVAAELDQL